MLKWLKIKEFFGLIGSFEGIWSIRAMGKEKYRGNNDPIGMGSKKGPFKNKNAECPGGQT
jgi:hypothetical protein